MLYGISQGQRFFLSVLLIAVTSASRLVPGPWWILYKYLLQNQRNELSWYFHMPGSMQRAFPATVLQSRCHDACLTDREAEGSEVRSKLKT
jgi:hypothetical protein